MGAVADGSRVSRGGFAIGIGDGPLVATLPERSPLRLATTTTARSAADAASTAIAGPRSLLGDGILDRLDRHPSASRGDGGGWLARQFRA
jgi:hypothetical protein